MAGRWKLINVTPQKASQWLSCQAKNRKLKQSLIERISDDIARGQWRVTHQGIAFNEQGQLVDGQNRLTAVVKAGTSIQCWAYTYDIDSESAAKRFDHGVSRTACDTLNISGTHITKNQLSCLRRMLANIKQEPYSVRYASVETLAQWWGDYSTAVEFATNLFRSRESRLCSASLIAPFARASYTADKSDLERIAAVITSGVTSLQKDSSLIKLRDYYMRASEGSGSQLGRVIAFRKTSQCISDVLKSKAWNGKEAESDLFPIPNDPFRVDE